MMNSKLLLSHDNLGQTTCHRAARWGYIEVLDKVMEWSKENLRAVEISSLLLTKDRMGHTSWHEAAELCNTAAFEILYELAREGKINLKNEIFLAQNKDGRNVLEILKEKKKKESERVKAIEVINPYPTAFPYGNGMVLHFYQQQESSTTKTVYKVINKGLKTYV